MVADQFAIKSSDFISTIFLISAPVMGHAILNVPANATVVNGSCGELEQWMLITWPNNTQSNSIHLTFAKNETTRQYYLGHVNVSLTPDEHFPNAC